MGYLEELSSQLEKAMRVQVLVQAIGNNKQELKEICEQLDALKRIGIDKANRDEDPSEEDWEKSKALNARYVKALEEYKKLAKELIAIEK